MVHSSDYIFNDLKPENVVINIVDGQPVATIIDFGVATKFKNPDGTHVDKSVKNESFDGNIMYSSVDHMNFFKTSRRDDLFALFYMLVVLMNDFQMIGSD